MGVVEAFGSCFTFIFPSHCFGSDRDEPKVTARCGVATNAFKPCLAAPPALDIRSGKSVLMKPQTSFQLEPMAGILQVYCSPNEGRGSVKRRYQEVGFWLGLGGSKAHTQHMAQCKTHQSENDAGDDAAAESRLK